MYTQSSLSLNPSITIDWPHSRPLLTDQSDYRLGLLAVAGVVPQMVTGIHNLGQGPSAPGIAAAAFP